jgi:hypothetical protein
VSDVPHGKGYGNLKMLLETPEVGGRLHKGSAERPLFKVPWRAEVAK